MTTDTITARPARGITAYDLLTIWHGLFAGAWAVSYLTAEAAMPLHRFAGYLALGLLAFRLAVALFARATSLCALPWANTALWQAFGKRLGQNAVAALAGRTPFAPLSALVLLAAVLLAGLSGLLADQRLGGDLHEGLSNASLAAVIAHFAIVASAPLLRRLRRP